jgi:hypothetical protein
MDGQALAPPQAGQPGSGWGRLCLLRRRECLGGQRDGDKRRNGLRITLEKADRAGEGDISVDRRARRL